MDGTHKKHKMSLGMGLGALLGEDVLYDEESHRIRAVPLHAIRPNPRQPRRHFDQEALHELAESIREQGVLQPVLLRQISGETGDSFELVAGERRWRAAQMAGLSELPALVREVDDSQSLEISILENLQREDLNPVEVAHGYDLLCREFGYNHKRIAKRIGMSRMAVTNTMRLLKLPESVLALVGEGQLSAGHARALLGLEEYPELLTALAARVVEEGLSVRQTEGLVREQLAAALAAVTPLEPAVEKGRRRDPTIEAMEKSLASELGNSVTITHSRGRGKVIVEYRTLEELEGLAERLLGRGAA